MSRLGQDFDNVAAVQLVTQRHHASVYVGSHTGVPNVRVDSVSKIDRGGVARQDHHFAFRGEGVDLFRIKIDLQSRQELVGIGDVTLPVNYLAQPRQVVDWQRDVSDP